MKRPPGAQPDVPLRVMLGRYRHTLALAAIVLLFVVPVLAYQWQQGQVCQDRGGAYVRGLWGFECVAAR